MYSLLENRWEIMDTTYWPAIFKPRGLLKVESEKSFTTFFLTSGTTFLMATMFKDLTSEAKKQLSEIIKQGPML
jgi:hypothetical protein